MIVTRSTKSVKLPTSIKILKIRAEPTTNKPKLSVQIKDTIVIIIIRYELFMLKHLIYPYSIRSVYF